MPPPILCKTKHFRQNGFLIFLLDIKLNKNVTLNVGANNIFDVYPDLIIDPRLTNDGIVIYSRFATQFGFNGAYYFVNLNLNF